MLDELIAKISTKLNITPDQTRAGLGIVLKFAQTEMGPKFDTVRSVVPDVDALIAAAPAPGGMAGALGGLLGGFGGGKLAGLAGLVGQAEQAGLSKDQLIAIGQHAVAFLETQGDRGAEVASLIKGFLP